MVCLIENKRCWVAKSRLRLRLVYYRMIHSLINWSMSNNFFFKTSVAHSMLIEDMWMQYSYIERRQVCFADREARSPKIRTIDSSERLRCWQRQCEKLCWIKGINIKILQGLTQQCNLHPLWYRSNQNRYLLIGSLSGWHSARQGEEAEQEISFCSKQTPSARSRQGIEPQCQAARMLKILVAGKLQGQFREMSLSVGTYHRQFVSPAHEISGMHGSKNIIFFNIKWMICSRSSQRARKKDEARLGRRMHWASLDFWTWLLLWDIVSNF
jgi:hypothetical protein